MPITGRTIVWAEMILHAELKRNKKPFKMGWLGFQYGVVVKMGKPKLVTFI
jgi:hypothetical protein